MVDYIQAGDLTPAAFFKKYVMGNRPVVIRGFVEPECNQAFQDYGTELEYHRIGHLPAGFRKFTKVCDHAYFGYLEKHPQVKVKDKYRYWKHQKGNTTPWHYDGNGTDIFNISLNGSKTFYLSAPDSIPCYPLSPIALPWDHRAQYTVVLKKNEMLYIPSYWFHKVVTNENDTVNVNYIFYYLDQKPSQRSVDLYRIHRFFSSKMCGDIICDIVGPGTGNDMWKALLVTGVEEMIPIFLLFLILYIIFNKAAMYLLIMLSAILIVLGNIDALNASTSGISGVYAAYSVGFNCLLAIVLQ